MIGLPTTMSTEQLRSIFTYKHTREYINKIVLKSLIQIEFDARGVVDLNRATGKMVEPEWIVCGYKRNRFHRENKTFCEL